MQTVPRMDVMLGEGLLAQLKYGQGKVGADNFTLENSFRQHCSDNSGTTGQVEYTHA